MLYMTILWFSNRSVLDEAMKESGTWLLAMARLITRSSDIKLVNVTLNPDSSSTKIATRTSASITEYLLPSWKLSRDMLPPVEACNEIQRLCSEIAPDIIHVWGVENYFSRLLPALNLDAKLLLEIQGLKHTCADVYMGDLSPAEMLNTLRTREYLFFSSKSIFAFQNKMRKEGERDLRVLEGYKYISTQSMWVRNQIKIHAPAAHVFDTRIALRDVFMSSMEWQYPTSLSPSFYVSAAGPAPYKSIQTAFRALRVLKKEYPDVKLYVIGDFQIRNLIHTSGYLYFLYGLIKKLQLEGNIIFTGPLSGNEIVEVARKSIAYIQTSYVESYSLAVAEAQALGVPCIISYAGAMPELAVHEETGLFYAPGDYASCAMMMQRLITDKSLAMRLSEQGRSLARERHAEDAVCASQILIYKSIYQ